VDFLCTHALALTKTAPSLITAIQPSLIHPMNRLTELDFWTIKLVYHTSGYMNLLKDEEAFPWAVELVPRPAGEGRTLRSKRNRPARYNEDPLEGVDLESDRPRKKARPTRNTRAQRASPRDAADADAPSYELKDTSKELRATSSQPILPDTNVNELSTRSRRRGTAGIKSSAASPGAPQSTSSPRGKRRALSSELSLSSDSTIAESSTRVISRASLESELTVVGETSEKTKGSSEEKDSSSQESDPSTAPMNTRKRRRQGPVSKAAPATLGNRASSKSSDLVSGEEELPRVSKRLRTVAAR
jgi:hypothetical protein